MVSRTTHSNQDIDSILGAEFLFRRLERELQELGQVLWKWSLCNECKNRQYCLDKERCPSQHNERLAHYFQHYRNLTSSYEPDLDPGEQPALLSVIFIKMFTSIDLRSTTR